jgi:hypothetical protein
MNWLWSRLSRSFKLTELTFGIVAKDPELLVFPLLYVLIAAPVVLGTNYTITAEPSRFAIVGHVAAPILMLSLFVVFVCNTLFGLCIAYTTKTRLQGDNATLGQSLWFGVKHSPLVALWLVVEGAVTLALLCLGSTRKRGPIGRFVLGPLHGLFSVGWGAARLFVHPAMAYKGLTPFRALSESVSALKRTWGEALVVRQGFRWVFGALIFGVICVFVPLVYAYPVPLTAMILYSAIILVTALFATLNAVWRTVLYHYALYGDAAMGYERSLLQSAFEPKR